MLKFSILLALLDCTFKVWFPPSVVTVSEHREPCYRLCTHSELAIRAVLKVVGQLFLCKITLGALLFRSCSRTTLVFLYTILYIIYSGRSSDGSDNEFLLLMWESGIEFCAPSHLGEWTSGKELSIRFFFCLYAHKRSKNKKEQIMITLWCRLRCLVFKNYVSF